jgi:hypothetical protein
MGRQCASNRWTGNRSVLLLRRATGLSHPSPILQPESSQPCSCTGWLFRDSWLVILFVCVALYDEAAMWVTIWHLTGQVGRRGWRKLLYLRHTREGASPAEPAAGTLGARLVIVHRRAIIHLHRECVKVTACFGQSCCQVSICSRPARLSCNLHVWRGRPTAGTSAPAAEPSVAICVERPTKFVKMIDKSTKFGYNGVVWPLRQGG